MTCNQILIQNIRKLISDSGMKQCAVARNAGIKPQVFSNMLNERKVITAEHIPMIAKALHVSVNKLYGIEENKKKAG